MFVIEMRGLDSTLVNDIVFVVLMLDFDMLLVVLFSRNVLRWCMRTRLEKC